MPADLHMHSTASDGTDPPHALPALAAAAGLNAFALTDHDTTAGLAACASASARLGITFVPGIELSADPGEHAELAGSPDFRGRRGTLHILGLFVRHDDPRLADIEVRMGEARNERNPAIVDRLRELGIDITYEEVEDLARAQGAAVIGRPHIAQVLIDRGVVADTSEAFALYLARGGAAYVRRDRLAPDHAIDAIHHAGGLAILAHPIQLSIESDEHLLAFLRNLKDLGLDGLETRHSDHDPTHVARYERFARDLDLLISGGSDYHGSRKTVALGGITLDDPAFNLLLAARPA